MNFTQSCGKSQRPGFRFALGRLAALTTLVSAISGGTLALAYPPAPHHLIFGCVRDEQGTPLVNPGPIIVLQTPTGTTLAANILPGVAPGVNFELQVPMDAGITPDPYAPLALRAAAPFKIYVVIGQTTNTPIQMTGNYSQLGRPGKETRIDLTLGTDANGDGIPDAWEYGFLAALGSNLSLNDLRSGMDLAHDGRTLLQEYLLGNYPMDPTDPLLVTLVALNGGSPILQFTGVTGRSYTVLGSADLKQWTPVSFLVPLEGSSAGTHSYYYAPSTDTVQVQVVQPASGPPKTFFRLQLQ